MPFWLISFSLLFSCSLAGTSPPLQDSQQQAEQMVSQQIEARGIDDNRVLQAMRKVPRHRFVPPPWENYAYQDRPLPIGHGQTISQPYVVALMTSLARPEPDDRALEVGTGSGYQAAVLAELVGEVYTIEIVSELAQRASNLLDLLGYENVHVRYGDGYQGWPEKDPFDIILITAAVEEIPKPLIEQLAEGGRLVMPQGDPSGSQVLTLYERRGGKLVEKKILPVRFVPMTGEALEKP